MKDSFEWKTGPFSSIGSWCAVPLGLEARPDVGLVLRDALPLSELYCGVQ